MNCAAVVQTCDKYRPFWSGFFNFMGKHWAAECPLYFCNEECDLELPKGFRQIKTGKGTFVENLRFILGSVKEENVFYMLEDFWPTAPMGKDLFRSLYEAFEANNMDALQVSSYLPYYSLSRTDLEVLGQNLLRFSTDSDWLFNFQARFWRRSLLLESLVEPTVSESVARSAITVEVECDKNFRGRDLEILMYHYQWYPISGVAYRGEFTEIGRQMENVRRIDELVKEKFK